MSAQTAGQHLPGNPYVPASLYEAEAELRRTRRGLDEGAHVPPAVGVGLSGGGIRSATFCLGFFQAISRLGMLGSVDYLSTVSGGGYFGAFLGRLFTRGYVHGAGDVANLLNGRTPNTPDADGQAAVLPWLRQNGRYLSPGGTVDVLQMLAVILRNWVAMHVTLASAALLAAFLIVLARAGVESGLDGRTYAWLAHSYWVSVDYGIWLSPLWVPTAAIFLFLALPLGWAYWLLEWSTDETVRARTLKSLGWVLGVMGPALAFAYPPFARGSFDTALARFLVTASALVIVGRGGTLLAQALGVKGPWGAPRQTPAALAIVSVSVLVAWLWAGGNRPAAYGGAVMLGVVLASWAAARLRWLIRPPREFRSDGPADLRGSAFPGDEHKRQAYYDAYARNRLTTWLRWWLVAGTAIAAVALVDSLGETLYRGSAAGGWRGNGAALAALLAALSAAAAPAAKVVPLLIRQGKGTRGRTLLNPLLAILAVLIVAAFLTGASFVAHAARWQLGPVTPVQPPPLTWLALGTAALGLFAMLFGATWSFLNNSSQLPFYKARLVRAYLGASNDKRLESAPAAGAGWAADRKFDPRSVLYPVPGDDIDLLEYYGVPAWNAEGRLAQGAAPYSKGAPLHLINVTVNCTKGGSSQIEQQDRKGLALSLGPCGLVAGRDSHVVFDRSVEAGDTPEPGRAGTVPVCHPAGESAKGSPFSVEPEGGSNGRAWLSMERLTLGYWTAISGAAFTTGTGYRTSLGLSLLAGMGNVRLGYWWDSRRARSGFIPSPGHLVRRLLAVQTYLRQEFLAQFPGTSRQHWYLSDGGHFENLGGYELIRRRVPLIVLVDAEADPGFSFEGLANLVRKARIDFGAEVRFLTAAELARAPLGKSRPHFGPIEALVRRPGRAPGPPPATGGATAGSAGAGLSRKHAALAIVTYRDAPDWSALVYVKASMTGDESVDLRQYHREHPAFPHEPTSDQFFDEAQWESYRKLGEHVGETLFGPQPSPWHPDAFRGADDPAWGPLISTLV